jgi:hypothetical protein
MVLPYHKGRNDKGIGIGFGVERNIGTHGHDLVFPGHCFKEI